MFGPARYRLAAGGTSRGVMLPVGFEPDDPRSPERRALRAQVFGPGVLPAHRMA